MLTVLSVAYPFAPVGPNAVGGAEQVLTQLDAALVRAGHRSLVVAAEGSVTRGILVPTERVAGPLGEDRLQAARERHGRAIQDALERWPVDVVHMHGLDFHHYLPPPGPPVLVTLHLPLDWYPRAALTPERPRTHLHCVSSTQRSTCPPGVILLPDVPNGVETGLLRADVRPRDYVAALGRICPEKGHHLALDAARRAGVPLLLGGEVFAYPEHERFFREEIAPRLDRRRRFLGPLGLGRKRRLLSAARSLLIPSLAPETSSLVAMEALACGAPVIAFPSGALLEIVEHGRTGFLVHDEREMADAIGAVGELSRAECMAVARERFSLEATLGRYLALYGSLSRGDRPRERDAHEHAA